MSTPTMGMDLANVPPGASPGYIDIDIDSAEPPLTVGVNTPTVAMPRRALLDTWGVMASKQLATVFAADSDDLAAWSRLQTVASPRETPQVATTGAGFSAMRAAFVASVALMTCGLLLASFALATGAGAFVKGLAAVALWSGQAAIAVAAHREGRRTGEYLLGERASLPVAVFTVGMVIVAVIATIEFSLR